MKTGTYPMLSGWYKAIYIMLLLSCYNTAWAQSVQEFKNSFNYGKKMIAEANYRQAVSTFQSLLKESPANPYTQYAAYFHALALIKTGRAAEAAKGLEQLLSRYASWNRADDARLLLAQAHFETANASAALKVLADIKQQAGMKEFISGMKLHYFEKLSIADLKRLNSQNPKDNELEKALLNALAGEILQGEDLALYEQLAKRQGQAGNAGSTAGTGVLKQEYNVAVVLPFFNAEPDPTKSYRRYQFVYDLYEGILIAQQKLQREGIKINLYAYDTERDNNKVKQLTERNILAGADLIIGPLYPNNADELARYAASRKIWMVNPIGNSADLLTRHNHVLLTEATSATQAKRAAEYAFAKLGGRKAYIYYGDSPDDTTMAANYRRHFEQLGGRVMVYRQTAAKGALTRLSSEFTSADPADSAHVFVATSQQAHAMSLLSAVLSRQRPLALVVTKNWLNFDQINFEQLEQARAHIIYPDFILPDSYHKSEFTSAYVAGMSMVPSPFAYQGYEIMYHFGKMLGRYGSDFVPRMRAVGLHKGLTMPGMDFQSANDNQFTPICTFREGQLELVNLPER